MQEDFHYYATYCASIIAGYSHEESQAICYSAQFVDLCTKTLIASLQGPLAAATTQLQMELMEARTDRAGLQDITRIWSSFHFLPYDLYAPCRGGKRYQNKYRLICNVNGDLLIDSVKLAKETGSLQAVGIAMHILADTWAHRYFAGTPSMVINNVSFYFYEKIRDGDSFRERQIKFKHSPSAPDDIENGAFSNSIQPNSENNIMNLGHGRAGHFPDYSFARYRYLPAWGNYEEILKDNPSDYYHAFCQMIAALKYLRGVNPSFEKEQYDTEAIAEWDEEIRQILEKRQLSASADWKALGERLSGCTIDDFDLERYQDEYRNAPDGTHSTGTFLGKFFFAALAQKSLVTNKIYKSGNPLAGVSVEYEKEQGLKGNRDYIRLVKHAEEKERKKRGKKE